MVLQPPPMPTRFPCWVRAIYSWGGESKHDLGFMEGDLIECLNAGDGSWWTGRLRRDRRMVGSFPSNFVEVMPENFTPVSRSVSPLVTQSNTPSPKNTPQKSKTFRKPFEAYEKAPHYTTAKQPETYKPGSERSSLNSFTTPTRQPLREVSHQNSVTRTANRAPSPAPQTPHHGSRAPSPAPSFINRAPSPAPSFVNTFASQQPFRAPSPPSQQYQAYHPRLSMEPEGPDSPPPPAPPPHRHVPGRHGSNASHEPRHSGHSGGGISRHGSHMSHLSHLSFETRPAPLHTPTHPRSHSPIPPSPNHSALEGHTPPQLRDAMDGVIEQLDILGMNSREPESPETPSFDPWSPESFDMVHQRSRRKHKKEQAMRPQTSMGIAQHPDEGYETYSGSGSSSRDNTQHSGYGGEQGQPPPQLSNYVERMETRLRNMHQHTQSTPSASMIPDEPPAPPPKNGMYERPKSSMDGAIAPDRKLRHKRSAYEVGRQVLGRTFTTKTNSTNATNSSTNTQSTNRSLMSGVSASGISATSAGSYARRNPYNRAQSALGIREPDADRPETPFTGVTYHSSHASGDSRPKSQAGFRDEMAGLGGLTQPAPIKQKKSGFFKKIIESAKTGVASSRGSIAMAGVGSVHSSPLNRSMGSAIGSMGMGPPPTGANAAREMGLGSGVDWVQVRRDVCRSNSLSRHERAERRDRCQMLDYPALNPVDELYETIDGDEGADGMPVQEPTNYLALNLSQVDKNSRFISSLPPMTTAISLATTYVCRPYRSDVQRLRAIFTWAAEKVCWEEDFEGEVDTRRVIQSKRACAEEYAVLVYEMCTAVGLHCEVVRGYLKTPGEIPEYGIMPRSNHWWNAVLVDNQWRLMDCCLASPSNPKRSLYSSVSNTAADGWYFLAQPSEMCYTHIPEHHAQQHLCPPVAHEILLNLPCACPPFFRNGLQMHDYNTSSMRIEDLEMVHVKFNVPDDVEVAAEVEVRAYTRDSDGDFFESGDTVRKRALAQAEWYGGIKRYTIKALLPGDEGTGVLKVYAGTRGLMHSIKDIPHPLAFALPIIHTGENPPYEFVARHPTPHAQRHDIYVVQPQCQRLALNNTFVFAIRQHPSSTSSSGTSNPSGDRAPSPSPFARPASAMSMTSSAAGSQPSTSSSTNSSQFVGGKKPAKLAVQTPGGKILRLMRKEEKSAGRGGVGVGVGSARVGEEEMSDGGTWETIIKCSERGVWRGLVLADRTARWCVFAEWICE